jgi:hypothetical protein
VSTTKVKAFVILIIIGSIFLTGCDTVDIGREKPSLLKKVQGQWKGNEVRRDGYLVIEDSTVEMYSYDEDCLNGDQGWYIWEDKVLSAENGRLSIGERGSEVEPEVVDVTVDNDRMTLRPTGSNDVWIEDGPHVFKKVESVPPPHTDCS